MMPNMVQCANCGKELIRKPCRTNGRNYCNASCQMKYEYANGIRNKFTITKEANKKIRELVETKKHPFQKEECRNKLRKIMGMDSYKEKQKQSHLKDKNGMYHKYGKKHHNYIDGESSIRKLLWNRCEYKEWRLKVFERDNYTCQMCNDNKGGNLNAHHIKSFKDYPELRYNVNNGITLCEDCHREIHKRGFKNEIYQS